MRERFLLWWLIFLAQNKEQWHRLLCQVLTHSDQIQEFPITHEIVWKCRRCQRYAPITEIHRVEELA